MNIAILLFFKRPPDNGVFDLLYGGTGLVLVAAWILWERVYRKKWQEYRSRNWTRVEGHFDEGEVITMRKGRSKAIAGYEVWLWYEYEFDGEQSGLYRLSSKTKEDADAGLTDLLMKRAVIRVNPKNPKQSLVSDQECAITQSGGSRAALR